MEENNMTQQTTPVQPMEQPVQAAPQPAYEQPVQAAPQPAYEQPVQAAPQPAYEQPVQAAPQQPYEQQTYAQPMQQPVYAQPVYDPAYAQPQPVSPKKSKKGLVIAGVVVAIALVTVIAVFLCLKLFASPKDKVEDAFDKLAAEMEERVNPAWKEVDFKTIAENMEKQPTLMEGTLNVTIEDPDSEFDTMGMDFTLETNKPEEKYALDLGLSIMNVKFLTLETVIMDEKIYLALPGLVEGNYSFDPDGLDEEVKEELLGDLNFVTFNTRELPTDEIPEEDLKALEEAFAALDKEYEKKWKEAIVFKKDGKVIHLTVDADVANDYLADATEILLESDAYEAVLESYVEQYKSNFPAEYYDESEIEDYTSRYKEEMEYAVETLLDVQLESDIQIDFTLDKKGRFTAIETVEEIELESEYLSGVEFELAFNGKERVSDAMEGTVKLGLVDGDEEGTLVVNFEDNLEFTKDAHNEECIVKLYMQEDKDDTIKIKYQGDWDLGSNEFDYKIAMTADDETMNITVKGALSNVVKGESFKLEIAKLKLEVPDEEPIEFSGYLGISKLTEDIKAPADAKELTEMGEGDLIALYQELMESFEEFEYLFE